MKMPSKADALALVGLAGLVARGLVVRVRAGQLSVLEPSSEEPDPEHVFLTVPGINLDDATRRAASAHARREGLDALDLVPDDLDVETAIETLTWTDPHTYRFSPFALHTGPARALLVSRRIAESAQLPIDRDLNPGELARCAYKTKRHACTTTDLAIAPTQDAQLPTPTQRATTLKVRFDFAARSYLVVETLLCLALGLGVRSAIKRRNPLVAAPFLAYTFEPLIAFTGKPIRPSGLGLSTWSRWPKRLAEIVGMHRAMVRQDAPSRIDNQRDVYRDLLRGGTQDFFEPRRPDCYLCGSTDLSVVVDVRDYYQHKPGRFVLERCRACGHILQNPRLSGKGLDFYYRDFYDGLGERRYDFVFGTQTSVYKRRVQVVRDVAKPRRWLDVGAGHGHFCVVAQSSCPEATVDGLDMGDSIDEAERRGWVNRGYRGQFTELADDLDSLYDVVSMHHYLEHTLDPVAELIAAATVLQPGGLLSIELPDPDSWLGRVFGKWWMVWFQPQHLHLLSIENLESLLSTCGFTVVTRQRRQAHLPLELMSAVGFVQDQLAPEPDLPWLAPSTPWSHVRRLGVVAAGLPFLTQALIIDRALAPLVSRLPGGPNTYRVLARRDAS